MMLTIDKLVMLKFPRREIQFENWTDCIIRSSPTFGTHTARGPTPFEATSGWRFVRYTKMGFLDSFWVYRIMRDLILFLTAATDSCVTSAHGVRVGESKFCRCRKECRGHQDHPKIRLWRFIRASTLQKLTFCIEPMLSWPDAEKT